MRIFAQLLVACLQLGFARLSKVLEHNGYLSSSKVLVQVYVAMRLVYLLDETWQSQQLSLQHGMHQEVTLHHHSWS